VVFRFLAQWIDRICSRATLNLCLDLIDHRRTGEPIYWGESGVGRLLIATWTFW
jgi:hypothetical protein